MLKRSLALLVAFAFGAVLNAQNFTLAKTNCDSMTGALFLRLDGIPGDSRDKCHRDEIELMSFQNTGRSLIVTKKIDRSSPLLFEYGLSGRGVAHAVLTVLESGAERRLMTYRATDIRVHSLDQVAGSADRETIELQFASLSTQSETSTAIAPPPAQAAIDVTLQIPSLGSTVVFTLNDGFSAGQMRDFVILKPLDGMSPKLMQAFQGGQHLAEITITLKPRGTSEVLQYKLTDVLVTGDTQQGSSSSQSERLQVKAARISLQHNSGTHPPVKTGWDLKSKTKV